MIIGGNHKRLDEYQLVDKFWVKCIQPEDLLNDSCGWMDVKYQIQVGENIWESWISEWSTDWDMIRHDMEHLIWHKETEILLFNEDEPTRIILRKESALESTVEVGDGIAYNWKRLIRIEVVPDNYIEEYDTGMRPFVGYAGQIDVIKALYSGLQSLASAYPEENEDDADFTRQNVSRKLTSPMLEVYIESLTREEKRNAETKAYQQESLRKELEADPLKKMIHDDDIDAQADYIADGDKEKVKTLYLRWANNYVDNTWGVKVPDPREEFIDRVTTETVEMYLAGLAKGLSVKDAHEKARWDLYCTLDHYRLKL